MIILALEFSSDRRSVAVARGGSVMAEAVEHTASRGTKVFTLIEKVLAEAKISREAVEAVAVGLGPGSYTGIRAAIAVAQGWHLATGAKLLGVNSVAAMALDAQAKGILGRVNLVVDAQRGEFYLATWELNQTGCREIEALRIVAASEIETRQARGEVLMGPEMKSVLFPTATMVARRADEVGEEIPLEPVYLREVSFVKAPPPRMI